MLLLFLVIAIFILIIIDLIVVVFCLFACLPLQISQSVWSPLTVERSLQDSCLGFLRLAFIMASLCYDVHLPTVKVRMCMVWLVKVSHIGSPASFAVGFMSVVRKRNVLPLFHSRSVCLSSSVAQIMFFFFPYGSIWYLNY